MNFYLGIVLLICLSIMRPAEGANLAKNVQEFNVLCRLFRIAYDGRQKKPEQLVDEDMEWSKIDTLYTDREKFANTTEKPPVEVDLGTLGKVRITSGTSLARVHAKAIMVEKQIGALRELSSKEKGSALTAARGVIEGLKKALAGETMKKIGEVDSEPPGLIQDGGNSEQRAHACVAKEGGNTVYAGISLSNDLACLCVPGEASYDQEVCGFATTGSGTQWKNAQTGAGTALKTAWTEILGACKSGHQNLGIGLTPENITNAIEHFHALLGGNVQAITGTATGKLVKWVLGLPDKDAVPTCKANDDSTADDICVNYADTSGVLKEILWRKRMDEVQDGLLQIRQAKQEGARIYETALRIVERQNEEIINLNISDTIGLGKDSPGNEDRNQVPTVSTAKTPAQESTPVNTATIQRFILPWILLI